MEPGRVYRPDKGKKDLDQCQTGQGPQKGLCPIGVHPRQQPVQKDPGKSRLDDAQQGGDDCGDHSKGNCRTRSFQLLHGKGPYTSGLSAGYKVFRGFKHQADTGKRLIKGFQGDAVAALGGVIQHSFVALESVQNYKVVEIPVDDAGKFAIGFQILRLESVALGAETVTSCRTQYIFCIGAIPGHTAVSAHLLQWKPFSIIGQDHG